MRVSRPPGLRVGEEIVVDGATYTIMGLSGSQARLVDVTGAESSVALADLLRAPGFGMVRGSPAALPPQGLLDGLPADAVERVRWWERHIVEVITGVPPGVGREARPRPEYDPVTRTLRQRELAKVGELAVGGQKVDRRGDRGGADHDFDLAWQAGAKSPQGYAL
jgi:putative transposase